MSTDHTDTPVEEPGRRLAVLVAVPVLLAVTVVVLTLALVPATGAGTPVGAAPLDLSTVPEPVASHYHAAEGLADTYRQVPCFCGCEELLAHRDLYDCFVRADGAGWEAHAAGCGVCIAESVLVRDLTDAGTDRVDIRQAVTDRFGTTPTTAPPT